MSAIITILNHWAGTWLGIMVAVAWQSALLVAIAAVIAGLLRRASPVVRYWLWQIVVIKLLLMPFWTFAIPLPSWPMNPPLKTTGEHATLQDRGGDFNNTVIGNRSQFSESRGVSDIQQTESHWKIFTTITWQMWLLAFWTLVVLWQIARLFRQRLSLIRLLKRGVSAGAELTVLVAEMAVQIGLRRMPAAITVAGDCPLFVCGLLQPKLVMPGKLMDSLGPAERRQVILHELAHVKRYDLLWGWPVEIARIVYFFNPLVYWAAYRLRLERELACDQLAMAHSGHSAADYAQTLVQVVSHASEPAAVQAAAIAAGLTGSEKVRDEG
jgi:beta-lactamase regulating signal transducer with metallopeptidase domain